MLSGMRPLFFLLLAVVAGRALAQAPKAPPAAPPEAKQFDFWIGEWTVTTPDGKVAGTNKIERIANGHGLLENWTSARGGHGKSLNAFHAAKRQWQQFWIGGDGVVLELAGGLDASGAMVMTGTGSKPGDTTLNRITWTPNTDGSVRQYWEISKDNGKTWSAIFEGRYERKK